MTTSSQKTEPIKSEGPLLWAIAVTVFLILSLLLFVNSMNKPPARDEQMYCTAGVLLSQGYTPYKDFAYVSQLPYHPLLLSWVYRLSRTTHYLLVARLVTVACEMMSLLCIMAIFRSILRPYRKHAAGLSIVAMILYVVNPIVFMANGYAWNHGVVVFLVLLALTILLRSPTSQDPSPRRYFFISFILTIASGMRITTLLLEAAILVFLWLNQTTSRKQVVRARLALGAGILTAGLWPLWIIAQAPHAFLLDLIRIPRVYGDYFLSTSATSGKTELALACLVQPGYLALVLVTIFIGFQARRWEVPSPDRKRQRLLYGILALTFVIAFIPPTLWRQYLAIPVPFLVLCLALPFRQLCRTAAEGHGRPLQQAWIALATATCITVTFQIITLQHNPLRLSPHAWEPMQLHTLSQQIADQVDDDKPLLTLAPLYALEGGCEIYPELSCGAIVFRVGDLLTDQEQTATHTLGPTHLFRLIKQKPPAAVLLGVEIPGYEAPLRQLINPSWSSFSWDHGVDLFLPPSSH